MTTPEGRIKNKLDRALKKLSPDVWYFGPQAGPYGAAGIPDRIVCANGKFFGIECKRDHNHHPTKLQVKCMQRIEAAGGECFVVYDDATINQAVNRIIDAL